MDENLNSWITEIFQAFSSDAGAIARQIHFSYLKSSPCLYLSVLRKRPPPLPTTAATAATATAATAWAARRRSESILRPNFRMSSKSCGLIFWLFQEYDPLELLRPLFEAAEAEAELEPREVNLRARILDLRAIARASLEKAWKSSEIHEFKFSSTVVLSPDLVEFVWNLCLILVFAFQETIEQLVERVGQMPEVRQSLITPKSSNLRANDSSMKSLINHATYQTSGFFIKNSTVQKSRPILKIPES